MKIEEVVPVVEPDYQITLSKEEYDRLIIAVTSLKNDRSWNHEYRDFFVQFLNAHKNNNL
ncbi:hypothetical protein SEA_WEASELS2_8 [Rhodococcus phage Weasels2]|uniref:Uncharacterized protein n=1 Tax=Rhodococcus phage Weasels2 TaxID=1897437 RepID=A0A1I9S9Z2_9CAUD|nr:hypothetical protein FDH04_gp008 [Rhodococcus phage Weasels2]AOZ63598.1 hypothetical protein SEA_WEASELS2_8 [Rhodococcus phage Weasels2]